MNRGCQGGSEALYDTLIQSQSESLLDEPINGMSRVLAVANQKGGVGKTTTCVNLAASLGSTRRRVLLVDLDPQGNATTGAGVDKHSLEVSSYEVLVGERDMRAAIVVREELGFSLLPSNGDLTAAEVKLMDQVAREQQLRRALADIRGEFDYVLIDCPPALNILTLNALVAADGVIIPMQCEYYALEGLSSLIRTIEDVRQSVNASLKLEGLVRTMFDNRNNLSGEVSAQLTNHFGERVYRTIIPRNIRLAEAPSFGKPVLFHDRTSRGALAYLALAGELLPKETPQGADVSGTGLDEGRF
jgi:chromosome partitioning protein